MKNKVLQKVLLRPIVPDDSHSWRSFLPESPLSVKLCWLLQAVGREWWWEISWAVFQQRLYESLWYGFSRMLGKDWLRGAVKGPARAMEINSPGGLLASPFSGHVLNSKWYLSKRVIEVMNQGVAMEVSPQPVGLTRATGSPF